MGRIAGVFNAGLSLLLWVSGIIHLVLALLFYLPILMVFGPRHSFLIARFLCRTQLLAMGALLQVEGAENFPQDQACLLMGNHESLFDIFAIIGALPDYAAALEAAPHFRLPVWGTIIRRWGVLPLPEGRLREAVASLERATDLLIEGTSVIILPEGHRSRDGHLGPLKKGAFRLARKSKADVLPFVLEGLYEFHNVHSWRIHPRVLRVRFCRLIPFTEIEDLPQDEFRNLIAEILRSPSCGIDPQDARV